MPEKKPDWKVRLENGKTVDLFRMFETAKRASDERLVADFKRIVQRFKALEARIDELEQVGYKGVYQRALTYRKGNLVTYSGSLWSCLRGTDEAPGSSAHWQLCARGT